MISGIEDDKISFDYYRCHLPKKPFPLQRLFGMQRPCRLSLEGHRSKLGPAFIKVRMKQADDDFETKNPGSSLPVYLKALPSCICCAKVSEQYRAGFPTRGASSLHALSQIAAANKRT